MTQLLAKVKSLINQDDFYIIFLNGNVIENNINSNIKINKSTSNLMDPKISNEQNFIHIAISQDTKLKIFHIINEEGSFTQEIEVTNQNNITIYEYLLNTTKCSFNSNLIASNNSTINYFSIKEGLSNSPLDYKIVSHLFNDSKITLHNLNANRNVVNEYIGGELLQSGSEYYVYAVDINTSKDKHQLDAVAHHKCGNSLSRFTCFGMVNNNSHSVINTNGFIYKHASMSDMNHKIKGIILDPKSTITANPILEIDDFDVVAGHGASVGDISQEDIYYLMSRGLTYEESRKLILSSLISPILDGFDDQLINNFVLEIVNNNI